MRFCSITLLTLVCATFLGGCRNTSGIRVPDGIYAPDPKIARFAGEVITVSGSKYRWSYFTDALPGPPDRNGRIEFLSDHIVLDGLEWNGKRMPSVIEGTPVLWTEEGHSGWKKTGLEVGLLYLQKP